MFLFVSSLRLIVVIAKVRKWDFRNVIRLLRRSAGPHHLVKFCIYCKNIYSIERAFSIGYCDEGRLEYLDNHMENRGYERINVFDVALFNDTEFSIALVGRYEIVSGPLKLK